MPVAWKPLSPYPSGISACSGGAAVSSRLPSIVNLPGAVRHQPTFTPPAYHTPWKDGTKPAQSHALAYQVSVSVAVFASGGRPLTYALCSQTAVAGEVAAVGTNV